ncbi:hypothetical protein DFJ74DRAFT_667073 [Hyaloraphidium curvatum]|nr:hypothetical protein DFJ74DRAFT_667073 [Hyaloraphidium curvatum]
MTYSTYAKSFETFGKDAIIRLLQSVEGSPITGITNKSFESTLFGNGYATFAAHIWDLSDFAPELAGRGPELWTFHSALTNGESVNYVFEKHVLKEVDDKGRPIGARRPASTKAEKEKRAEEAEKKKWEDYKKFLDEGVKLAQLDELLALIIPSNDPGERNLLCGTRNLNKPQFRVVKNACDKPPVNPKTGEVIDVAPLLQKVYVRNEDGTCTTWVKSCRRDPITGMLTGIELREEVTLADKADKAEKYWQEHGVNPDQLEGLKKLKPHRPAENQEPKDTYGSTWQSMRGPRPPKRSDDSVGRPRSANVDDSFSRRKWSDNELVLEWLLWTKRNYRCLPHDWDEAEHGPMAQRGREERARAKAEREKERAQRQQAESAGAADTGSDLEGAEAMDTASEAGSASGSAGSGGGDAGGAELENVMADAGGDDAQDEGAMAAEFEGDVDEQLEAGHEAAEEELDSDYESDASSSSSSGSSEYKPAAARKPKRAPSKPAKEASKSSRKAKASKRSLVFIDEDEEEPEIPQQEMQRNKEMWLALGMLPRKNAFRAEAIYSLSKQEHRRQCGFIEYQRESDKFKKAHKLPHCYVVDHEEVEKRKRGESDRTDLPIKKLEGEMTLKEWESGLPTKRTTDPDKLVLFLACHLNTQLPVYEFYKRHQLTDLKRRVTARAAATVDRFVEEFVSPFWMRVPIERARKLDGICKNKKIKIEMMFPDASRFSDPPYLGRRRKKKPPDKDDAKKQEEADKEVLRKAKEGEVFIRMFVAPTLVDGDAVWPHTIRGSTHAPTLRYAAAFDRLHARWNLPGSERRMLKAPMKEYHTSACCSSCLETRLRMAASRFVERRKLIWGVKKCIRCHIMWNRDVNAGRNMVHLFVFGCLTGGMRPPAFRVGY